MTSSRAVSASTAFGLLISLLYLAGILSGCGEGSSTSQASVRSLNTYVASPGTDGSITITSGTAPITGTSSVPFGTFANGGAYASVPSGAFSANLSGPSFSTIVPFTTLLNPASYTLIAVGEEGQTGTLVPQLVALPNLTANQISIPSGSAGIRIVNVSLDSDPLGLYTTNASVPTAPLAASLGSIPFGFGSVANLYEAIPVAQISNLALVDANNPTAALALSTGSNLTNSPPTFVTGQAYTLYIYGVPGSSTQPLGATWVQDFP